METLISFLKSLFPFQGYKFCVLDVKNDILIGLNNRRKAGICPACNKRCSNIEYEYERYVRDLDLAGRKCYLRIKQKKIRCNCGYRGLEKLDFIAKYDRVTLRLALNVAKDCEEACLKEIARRYKLDWKTVKEIDKEHIKKLLPNIEKLKITRLAIDEIAVMKGHKYLTIIRDYDTGIPVKIFFGRAYEETSEALKSLGKERLSKIEYISMDMWDPYIKAVKEHCPKAKYVFDKFHVIKKISEALDKVRKNEFKDADDNERKNMKHKRWVILKREKNLNEKEKDDLKNIIKNNERLFRSYLLKEQILSIFDDKFSTFENICTRIKCWIENILGNDLDEFTEVIKTMINNMTGILNYFRYNMTNAIAEGFNTKINIIKRRAYGFKDIEYFMLKIYQSTLHRLA